MKNWLLGAAMCALLPNVGAAQTAENFIIDTTADLVALCSVEPGTDAYTAAIHFCHGYGHGAIQYYLIQLQAHPEAQIFCATEPIPTRDEAWAGFLAWMGENEDMLGGEALDAVFMYLAETYPC